MLRVFIADDHAIFRQGLRKLLQDHHDFQVVGEASDGHAALAAAQPGKWDLLLLDLSLPGLGGLEVLRRVKAQLPSAKVVVLSMYPEEQYAVRLVAQGASAYVSKDRPPLELIEALRTVARGGTYINPDVAVQSLNQPGDKARPAHESLSPREYQVFTLLFQGRTVTEIAGELELGVSTVSNHVRHVKDKLGARSLADVVTYAHQAGLVGHGGP